MEIVDLEDSLKHVKFIEINDLDEFRSSSYSLTTESSPEVDSEEDD